jgi:hypothetical protein
MQGWSVSCQASWGGLLQKWLNLTSWVYLNGILCSHHSNLRKTQLGPSLLLRP